jgi:hypothetical protein
VFCDHRERLPLTRAFAEPRDSSDDDAQGTGENVLIHDPEATEEDMMLVIPLRPRGLEILLLFLLALPLPVGSQLPRDPVEIAAMATAATVQIEVLDERGRTRGAGSGFVVREDGVVVTSFHVVQNGHSLRIVLANGDEHTAIDYLGGNPEHDIALLKLPAHGLHALPLGDCTAAQVGQRVYTMGHPLGQTATFSDGLVSALRTVEDVSVIQITAPISVGSSGGPVMNPAGEVIGIATMMLRGGQNLNFAVPVQYVLPLLAAETDPRAFSRSLLPRVRSGIAALGRPSQPDRRPRAAGPPASARIPEPRDEWEQQVLRQIAEIDSALTAEGVAERSNTVETGALSDGESDLLSIELRAGVPYAVIGVCDADCFDVDLRLFTPDGTLLERDVRLTDVPFVMFQPSTSGTYRLEITMSGCAVSPCRYAVGSFIVHRQ